MFFIIYTLQEGLTPLLTPDIVSERGRIRGEGPPLNEGEGVCQRYEGGRHRVYKLLTIKYL